VSGGIKSTFIDQWDDSSGSGGSSTSGIRMPPDTTPTSHTGTPTHIETRTHNQCGDTIKKSQAPIHGCINVRNMLSIQEVK